MKQIEIRRIMNRAKIYQAKQKIYKLYFPDFDWNLKNACGIIYRDNGELSEAIAVFGQQMIDALNEELEQKGYNIEISFE